MNPADPPSATLSGRIVVIRELVFGAGRPGLIAVARRFALPVRTWSNYEAGVTMPAWIMLEFLVATRANPSWLLEGRGDRFLVDKSIDRFIPNSTEEDY